LNSRSRTCTASLLVKRARQASMGLKNTSSASSHMCTARKVVKHEYAAARQAGLRGRTVVRVHLTPPLAAPCALAEVLAPAKSDSNRPVSQPARGTARWTGAPLAVLGLREESHSLGRSLERLQIARARTQPKRCDARRAGRTASASSTVVLLSSASRKAAMASYCNALRGSQQVAPHATWILS
jgi:hypothetical protein